MFKVFIDGQQVGKADFAKSAIEQLDQHAHFESFGTAVITNSKIEGPVWQRLRYLVGVMCEPTFTTPSGIVKKKTNKQRDEERAVAEAVVRFAFDHLGIRGDEGNLAPSGLQVQLMRECGGYRFHHAD